VIYTLCVLHNGNITPIFQSVSFPHCIALCNKVERYRKKLYVSAKTKRQREHMYNLDQIFKREFNNDLFWFSNCVSRKYYKFVVVEGVVSCQM